jgi:hypothetical protein
MIRRKGKTQHFKRKGTSEISWLSLFSPASHIMNDEEGDYEQIEQLQNDNKPWK